MYKSHSKIATPERSQIIWRYMSLEKFLSLLNERQLYFARQDRFFDSKEGMRSNADLSLYDEVVPGISNQIKNDPFGCGFINCWMMSDLELYLMWSAYSSLDKGIAIKSTVGNLIDSLDPNDERWIYISKVKYIDYSYDSTFDMAGGSANDLARYFCKRNYFQQENELRLVHYDYQMRLDDNVFGIKFNVSLDILIDEICIAPQADDWYIKLIKDEVKLHNISKSITLSHLI